MILKLIFLLNFICYASSYSISEICISEEDTSTDTIAYTTYFNALERLLRLLKIKPNNRILCARIAEYYLKLGEYSMSIKYADIALNSNEIFTRAINIKVMSLYRLGKKEFCANNFEQAEFYLRQTLELRPKHKFALVFLAVIYWIREMYEDAAHLSSLALQQDKSLNLSRLVYGKSLYKWGQYELYKTNNYDKAIELLNTSRKFRPKNRLVFTDLAFAYMKKNNFTECILNCDLALKYDMNNLNVEKYRAFCSISLSRVYFELKNYEKFVLHLKQAFRTYSANATTYAHYAQVLSGLKYYNYSLEFAHYALELNPNNQMAQQIKIESTNCLYKDWTYFNLYC